MPVLTREDEAPRATAESADHDGVRRRSRWRGARRIRGVHHPERGAGRPGQTRPSGDQTISSSMGPASGNTACGSPLGSATTSSIGPAKVGEPVAAGRRGRARGRDEHLGHAAHRVERGDGPGISGAGDDTVPSAVVVQDRPADAEGRGGIGREREVHEEGLVLLGIGIAQDLDGRHGRVPERVRSRPGRTSPGSRRFPSPTRRRAPSGTRPWSCPRSAEEDELGAVSVS